jgi:hypothetical protein
MFTIPGEIKSLLLLEQSSIISSGCSRRFINLFWAVCPEDWTLFWFSLP